jgi:HEPN domain-containing protein
MPGNSEVLKIVQEWIEKAENDIRNAVFTLKMRDRCPTDTVCFHAQQCVEKYLKAFLVLKAINFPKTHDIEALISLLPAKYRPKLTSEEQRRLTDYATVTRYPGDYEPIPLAGARRAVSVARRVRNEMRKMLPKESLRRK